MRKVCFGFAILILSAEAPNTAPKAELFGGYQFTHLDGGPNMNGWNGALTGNFNRWFGVTGDFSGVYGSGLSFHTYTFGPEVHAYLPLVKPFAHALFGGARASTGGVATNGFDMLLGGGIDTGHGPLAFRVAQFDWMTTRFLRLHRSQNRARFNRVGAPLLSHRIDLSLRGLWARALVVSASEKNT